MARNSFSVEINYTFAFVYVNANIFVYVLNFSICHTNLKFYIFLYSALRSDTSKVELLDYSLWVNNFVNKYTNLVESKSD